MTELQDQRRASVEHVEPLRSGAELDLLSRGRYQICMELAAGGMGSVFLALYRGVDGFERVVALKRMHSSFSSQAQFVKMFFDEAQALARVNHPAVCQLLDLGRTEDSYFLAMDYLEGESLGAILSALSKLNRKRDERRWPLVAARIMARLSDGLHAVHQARDEKGTLLNLIHRDITPQNLFVLYDGTMRLVDFGIARAEGMLHKTTGGVVKGKVAYMAPEQFSRRKEDARCDIWSMGVVLWELLCCRPLFSGRSLGVTVRDVSERPIPAPSTINHHVPDRLDAIVLKALERDPDQRYQTAQQLGMDLEAFLSESSDTVPAAHIAEWIDRLFPGRAAEKRGLRAIAHTMGERLAPPSFRPFKNEKTPERAFGEEDDAETSVNIAITIASLPAITEADRLSSHGMAAVANGDASAKSPSTPAAQSETLSPPTRPRTMRVNAGLAAAVMFLGCVALGLAVWKTIHAADSRAAAAELRMMHEAQAHSEASVRAETRAREAQDALAATMAKARPTAPAPVVAAPQTQAQTKNSVQPAPAPQPSAAAAFVPRQAAVKSTLTSTTQPVAAKPAVNAVANLAKPAKAPPSAAAAKVTKASDLAAGEASVQIQTAGHGATVLWQGKELGKTPLTTRLPLGVQHLTVRSASGMPMLLDVNVKAGETTVASLPPF